MPICLSHYTSIDGTAAGLRRCDVLGHETSAVAFPEISRQSAILIRLPPRERLSLAASGSARLARSVTRTFFTAKKPEEAHHRDRVMISKPTTSALTNSDDASAAERPESQPIPCSGVLELHPKGYGFLRSGENDYHQLPGDVFVPKATIDTLALRPGLLVRGVAVAAEGVQGPKLVEIIAVDGIPPAEYKSVSNSSASRPLPPMIGCNWKPALTR